jgi:hypothetical protein
MTLEEVNDHIVTIREALVAKRHQLPRLLLENPGLAMRVRYQIECLEPRLDELERQSLRIAKEREAAVAALPAVV